MVLGSGKTTQNDMLKPVHTVIQDPIMCILEQLTFRDITLVSLDWPWWAYLHHGYWQILYIQVFFFRSGKLVVKHLPAHHKVHKENKIESRDEICSRRGGYFGMVRKQVTLYLIEIFVK